MVHVGFKEFVFFVAKYLGLDLMFLGIMIHCWSKEK